MDTGGATQNQSTPTAHSHHPRYPEGKVTGALDPARVDAATAALTAAGFAINEIEILSADDVEGSESPLNRSGPARLVARFFLSTGDDLDRIERARQELTAGRVLISVPVAGDDDKHHVRDILHDHGGHAITYFGRWTITSFT